jgi:hypothetical protein
LILLVFSAVCLVLASIYMSQVMHGILIAFPPVSWSQSGAGSLYWLPPSVTFAVSCFNIYAYQRYSMPLIYGLVFSCGMCAGWVATIAWWFQCHNNTWVIDERFCFQRSLRSGLGNQKYRFVDEGISNATLAFGVMIPIIYFLYVATTGIYHRRYRDRRDRKSSDWNDGYPSGDEMTEGGVRDGYFSIGTLSTYWWSNDGGDGGGGGGGDGGS